MLHIFGIQDHAPDECIHQLWGGSSHSMLNNGKDSVVVGGHTEGR